jgi:4-oxalocrotonate tautomerase
MPHVIVKLYPGMAEEAKQTLAHEIVQSVMKASRLGPESVSVAFEDVPASRWPEEVYRGDILNGKAKLYKPPGYTM